MNLCGNTYCRLGFRSIRASKTKFHDQQRQKLEKLETQIKDLREGGPLDSGRGSGIRGRIEGSLRGMSL